MKISVVICAPDRKVRDRAGGDGLWESRTHGPSHPG